MARERPKNVGILAMDIYFPALYVKQEELEQYDGVSAGKYTAGLGQIDMSFTGDREDIASMALTVVRSLMEKYSVPYSAVGRLEVGTETLYDKSKAVKTVIMQLFQENGNTEIEGIDNLNACYGGTSALFNAVNWIESSTWEMDGRLALVVAGDIAVYAPGPARPTGGAGAIAMLIGPDAPLVLEPGVKGVHMENSYDFYKPVMNSEYPIVDGHYSVECYLRALDTCYQRYKSKFKLKYNVNVSTHDPNTIDYVLFHAPYSKLVQKALARLTFNDFLDNPNDPYFQSTNGSSNNLNNFLHTTLHNSYMNRELEQAFTNFTKDIFANKCLDSLFLSKHLGNIYSGSLYACLLSLLNCKAKEELEGKRLLMFSYGSGLASSMYSILIRNYSSTHNPSPNPNPNATGHWTIESLVEKADIKNKIKLRTKATPQQFTDMLARREKCYTLHSYSPQDPISSLRDSTYYLEQVDDKYRRKYGFYRDSKESAQVTPQ